MDAALLLLTDSRLPAGGHAHSGGAEEAVRIGAITGQDDLARFLRGRLATAGLVTAALAAAACELATATAHADPVGPGDRPYGPAAKPGELRSGAPAWPGDPDGEPSTREPRGRQPGAREPRGREPRGRQPRGPEPCSAYESSGPGEPGEHAAGDEAAYTSDTAILRWRHLDAEADARTASPAQREASRTQGRLLVRTARRIWPSAALDSLAKAVPDGAHHPLALGATAAAAGCDPYQAALAAAYNSVTGPATAAVRLLGLDPVTVHRLLADLAPALNDAAHEACASLMDTVLTTGQALPMDHSSLATDPAQSRHTAQAKETPLARHKAEASGTAEANPSGVGAHAGGTVWAALPAHAAPALDLLAERHRANEVKLFVS
jgi:urease accessory protein